MIRSAGLLMYRRGERGIEVLLVHPGGPFFTRKDKGAWTIPKGLAGENEIEFDAAKREFKEETSFEVRAEHFIPLGEIRQKGGKVVVAWACEGDCDASAIRSNTFEMDWPPRSGRTATFPEIDRAEWFDLEAARSRIMEAQRPFLDRLREAVSEGS